MLLTRIRNIVALIPGTRAYTAKQKKVMEHTLRRAGYSRSESLEIVARYFKAKNET